jgi:predicted nucleic-acid-binding Zn-ribbon protein
MQCPKCSSNNTQRLEVIYEKETRNSILAQKVTPPKKEEWGGSIIFIIIGLVCLGFSGVVIKIIGLIIGSIGIYLIYTSLKFNFKEFDEVYNFWKKSWYCNKCGNIFHEVESYLEYDKGD